MGDSALIATPLIPPARRWKRLGWKTWLAAAAVPMIAAVTAPWWLGPGCPQQLVIATGSAQGTYYETACRYREILAEDGIRLDVRVTAGSQENIRLLQEQKGEVEVALVQGGMAESAGETDITALASLYLEPIWVFYVNDQPIDQITALAGKRIAIGEPGSGSRPLALRLLGENGLLADANSPDKKADPEAKLPAVKHLPLGGQAAADALRRGELDAAIFVISPRAKLIRELLAAPGVQLMSFDRAEAYTRRLPFLTHTTLPEGTVDLTANLPAQDVQLLSVTANLVGRADLHPALVPLLLKAAHEVHERGGLLERAEAFPSLYHVDFPVNRKAKSYFKSGPSFFYRYLPFTLAAWLDHLKLLLLPMCTLLLPLAKAAPPLYRWRIRSKIYRWYRVLRDIDQQLRMSNEDARLVTQIDTARQIETLRRMENELAEVSVPLSYMEEFYNLRLHVAFVLHRLESRQHQAGERAHRPAA